MASIDTIKQKQDKLMNELRNKKVRLKEIGIWLAYKENRKSSYDSTAIGRKLRRPNIEDLNYLNLSLKELLTDLNDDEEREKVLNIIYQKESNIKTIETWEAVITSFVSEQIELALLNKEQNLKIEAIGMKLGSLYRVLTAYLDQNKLPNLTLDCVIIDPNSSGMEYRGIIESNNKGYHSSIDAGIKNWQQFYVEANEKGEHKIRFRMLKPDPNTYMIRINQEMLISPYLKSVRSTYSNRLINEIENPQIFQDVYNLYQSYFKEDKLSIDMEWEKDYSNRMKTP